MQGIPQNPDFLVITGFGKDSRENLWVLNYWAADRNTLSMRTPDSTWYHLLIPAAPNIALEGYYNLVIDPYDTKWFSCSNTSRLGLFYFNENKTYEDPSDDRSDYLSTTDGLNTNDIRDVVVDRRGEVWVATSLGVNVITNTALRLEIVFLTSAQAGLNMQTAYDLWHMAKVRKSLTATFHPMAAEVSLQRKITGQGLQGLLPKCRFDILLTDEDREQ